MPKHFNDIGFEAYSGLVELMEQGCYTAEQSADFFLWKAKQGEREEKSNEGGRFYEVR